MSALALAGLLAGAGAAIAWAGGRAALVDPPRILVRPNVSGAPVPAVLGAWVAIAGAAAVVLHAVLSELRVWDAPAPGRIAGAALVVLAAMGGAGRWDDRRGDEPARGFAGHLGAARQGRVSGGLVKIAAACGAGGAAGALLAPWDAVTIGLIVAAVGLGANLVNLLDRAPGRAGKAALLWGALLAAFGDPAWAVAAAGTFGGLVAVLPYDLGERGMLGDAGANPVGALLGLGLAVSLDTPALAGAVAVLLLLNLASERWSFSEVIERTPALRTLDRLGRK
jgi:UDP-GlcNAc:undecaprenyl-phosphate GlcNAc-1-phosphate transferase